MDWLKKLSLNLTGNKNVALDALLANGLHYVIQIGVAVVILGIGWWLINRFLSFLDKRLENSKKLDTTIKSFVRNFIHIGLRALLILIVLNIVGIQTTSIVAILGAASFAVGLALQGSLANFAGGVLILVFKPFKIGDVIEAHGKVGRVKEIQLFNSIMVTGDNKTVIVPNSKLTGEILTNYTKLGSVQTDIEFKLKANVDLNIVRKEIKELLAAMPEVLANPAPAVFLKDFDNDNVHLILRFNIAVGHSTEVTFKVREQIYFLVKKLEDKGVISEENHEKLDLGSNLITAK